MLFDLVAWQASCVQVIKAEAESRGLAIIEVHKARTGTWYVRVGDAAGGLCCVRLGCHRVSRVASQGNALLLSIRRGATGRLRQVGAFFDAVACRPRASIP